MTRFLFFFVRRVDSSLHENEDWALGFFVVARKKESFRSFIAELHLDDLLRATLPDLFNNIVEGTTPSASLLYTMLSLCGDFDESSLCH